MKAEPQRGLLRLMGPALLPGMPLSTYRVQFNRDFTFRDAIAIVPYLHMLGVSHCYASPYLKARDGSTHGYDIVDHNAVNPEIGTPKDFDDFVATLRDYGMGQILDIVPNHMGVGGDDNGWWLDVLENGQASPYAQFFDIDWHPLKAELRGKVLLPLLGDHYGTVLESGALKLTFDAEHGSFSVRYFEHKFPVDPATYPVLLRCGLASLKARLRDQGAHIAEFESLISALTHLPKKRDTAPEKREERARDEALLKERLAALVRNSAVIHDRLVRTVAHFNGRPGDSASFDALHALLQQQAYRLAYWRVASDEVNYRRFFDINALAGLRTERADVFDATHRLILGLIAEGKVQGLRIDHPDGLYDPEQYYRRLQSSIANVSNGANGGIYLIVEKILAPYEHLREDWPVNGTTGYEFANLVNGLFVDPASERALTRLYERFAGRSGDFDELLYERKKLIMKVSLAGELAVLGNLANRISEADRYTQDFTTNGLRSAIMEIVACFPVYRTYVTEGQVTTEDRRYVEWAIAQAKKRSFAGDISIFDFLQGLLLLEGLAQRDPHTRLLAVDFAHKFQQYTAPVMAKGLEDTSFYIYNRLVSLNEVGGDPRRFGVSLAAFHHANQERARRWPHSLLSTSTHDSKRSEDVRARIDVLSEIPHEWSVRLSHWTRINRYKKLPIGDRRTPARNDEYLLYQTLIGTWPPGDPDEAALGEFEARVQAYMLKAVREAKVNSGWLNPDADYERGVREFVAALFVRSHKNLFLADFIPFQRRVARAGALNSLSQTLLKLTAPGVPDLYQGCELYDFSLVDPDNRRPIDYAQRLALLNALPQPAPGPVRALIAQLNGQAKLYVVQHALALRHHHPELFQAGLYSPLAAHGRHADHLCAFARNYGDRHAVILAPRWFTRLMNHDDLMPSADTWTSTRLEVPAAGQYRNVFTGEITSSEHDANGSRLRVAGLLAHFPVALLVHEP